MKRVADEEPNLLNKRSKAGHSSIFDDATLQRDFSAIFQNGFETPGYISGRFFMTWIPINKKMRTIMDVAETEGGKTHRFEVVLSGRCADFFEQLDFKPQDQILLSLKGARVERLVKLSGACTEPIKIHYEEGVAVQCVKCRGKGEGQVVDTWTLQESSNGEDDWFSTPRQPLQPLPHIVEGQKARKSSTIKTPVDLALASYEVTNQELRDNLNEHNATSLPSNDTMQPTTRYPTPLRSSVGVSPLSIPVALPATAEPPPASPKLTKKQQRLLKKAQRASLNTRHPGTSVEITPIPVEPVIPLTVVENHISTSMQSVTEAAIVPQISGPIVISVSSSRTPFHVVPDLELQEHSKNNISIYSDLYKPLNNLIVNQVAHLVGVVLSASSPSTTRGGDWMCNVRIGDQSNTNVDDLAFRGFPVNCFFKYEQWAPSATPGDIIILRNIKIVKFHDNTMGTGYNNKVQWVLYNPDSGKVHHTELGDTPEFEGLADGFGYEYTPFFHPGEPDIRLCLKLSDWWRTIQQKRQEDIGKVIQIGGSTYTSYASGIRTQRQHRLICEAGPEVPPQGFFDCTVEVLQGHANENGVFSLYVTDYTSNTTVIPVQASWCPNGLSEFVLKMEMWDEAAEIGRTMLAGDYYSIRNARMKVSRGGYVEGKVGEPKIQKLEKEDATHNRHLNALLERKKAWQDENGSSSSEFDHLLIQDAANNIFFNCTVEILHAVYDPQGTSCIYITDYTSNSELTFTRLNGGWSYGLEGRIVKVVLFDLQVEIAKCVTPKSFYIIKKLRLKRSTTAQHFQGRLGGNESLIHMIKPQSTDDNYMKLLERKEQWSRGLSGCNIKTQQPYGSTLTKKQYIYTSIKEIQERTTLPGKFRVIARIVDFWPLNLRDAFISFCSNCQKEFSKEKRACVGCGDADHDYVQYRYQLFFMLQDEEENKLQVSVSDDCSLLEGLDRSDLRDNSLVYEKFHQRLEPLIGNLLEVHRDLTHPTVANTPTLRFIIVQWAVEGSKAYGLERYEGVAD